MAKSVFDLTFLNRLAILCGDIELVDVVNISSKKGLLTKDDSEHIFHCIEPNIHPTLSKRIKTDYNRKMAIRHLKSVVYSAFIKEIYEELTIYLRGILKAGAMKGSDPSRIVGEHNITITANSLLRLRSWENVITHVSNSIFRALEEKRSTPELLNKINKKLNLDIPQEIIDAAMPYLEMRHILVHADGIADHKYCTSFPEIGLSPGQKVSINYSVYMKAKAAISGLVRTYDKFIIANSIIGESHIQK